MSREIPKPGEFYRHFKNKLYQIVTVAEHTETKEKLVIYQALYGTYRTYARPLPMFMSEVDHKKYPEITQKYRFEKIVPGEEENNPEEKNERDIIGELLRNEAGSLPEKAPDGRPFRKIENTRSASEARVQKKREYHLPITRREDLQRTSDMDDDADSDLLDEDYRNAEFLTGQESMVLPRAERSETKEEELWKSLTMEAEKAQEENGGEEENDEVSPRFLDFLEARTYESKAVILESMKDELDDDMINGLALALDVEIPAGDIEERYRSLRQCIWTMARFEDHRLR